MGIKAKLQLQPMVQATIATANATCKLYYYSVYSVSQRCSDAITVFWSIFKLCSSCAQVVQSHLSVSVSKQPCHSDTKPIADWAVQSGIRAKEILAQINPLRSTSAPQKPPASKPINHPHGRVQREESHNIYFWKGRPRPILMSTSNTDCIRQEILPYAIDKKTYPL